MGLVDHLPLLIIRDKFSILLIPTNLSLNIASDRHLVFVWKTCPPKKNPKPLGINFHYIKYKKSKVGDLNRA